MQDMVQVEEIQTLDRDGRALIVHAAFVSGHVLFFDAYSVAPSLKIESKVFISALKEIH